MYGYRGGCPRVIEIKAQEEFGFRVVDVRLSCLTVSASPLVPGCPSLSHPSASLQSWEMILSLCPSFCGVLVSLAVKGSMTFKPAEQAPASSVRLNVSSTPHCPVHWMVFLL